MQYSVEQLVEGIRSHNRRFVAKAITLVESTLPAHFEQAQQILEAILPETGNSLRLGISGVPGVGKSTFIEAFGLYLIGKGFRVAVLAVDPSSPITGGSILGDKTRMPQLSINNASFIRPSPSGGVLGGVSRKTRETLMICEAAGYDVIIVETVGVGQSETTVSSMVDCFLVLMLPNAGDELQGIKKGILEQADLIAINKADGSYLSSAKLAYREYSRALHLLQSPRTAWKPKVRLCSAQEKSGLSEIWEDIQAFQTRIQLSGEWDAQRERQAHHWMWSLVDGELKSRFRQKPQVQALIPTLEKAIGEGSQHPTAAARRLLAAGGMD